MKPLLSILAVAVCAGLGWCVYDYSEQLAETEKKPKLTPPVAVEVTRLRTRPVKEQVDFVGSLKAAANVELRSRISGYITAVHCEVGDVVKAGQLIVELDDSKYQEAVTSAEAALNVAQAQLLAQQARVQQAQSEVDRHQRLADSGAGTAQQTESVQTSLAIANAEVELEQAHVDQASSELSHSKLALKETRIESPMPGFIAERLVDVGDLSKPDITFVRIVDLSKVHTVVHVIEKDYEKLQIDQPATIRVDAFPDETFTGKVVRKAPVLDPDTRTAEVHIEIPNPNTLLKPGMHARVSLTYRAREDADVVPVASLIDGEGEKTSVWVVDGNPPQTQLREVKTGIVDGDTVEILSGLSPDDRIVMLGSRMAEAGRIVEVVEMASRDPSSPSEGKASNKADDAQTGE